MIVSLAEMIIRGQAANREELEELYRQYVCPDICSTGLSLMRESELKRYVAISIYHVNRSEYSHNRRLIDLITRSIGVSETSVYDWLARQRMSLRSA